VFCFWYSGRNFTLLFSVLFTYVACLICPPHGIIFRNMFLFSLLRMKRLFVTPYPLVVPVLRVLSLAPDS